MKIYAGDNNITFIYELILSIHFHNIVNLCENLITLVNKLLQKDACTYIIDQITAISYELKPSDSLLLISMITHSTVFPGAPQIIFTSPNIYQCFKVKPYNLYS